MTSLTLCTFCAQCIATDTGLPLTVRLMFMAAKANYFLCLFFVQSSQTADLFPCSPIDGTARIFSKNLMPWLGFEPMTDGDAPP